MCVVLRPAASSLDWYVEHEVERLEIEKRWKIEKEWVEKLVEFSYTKAAPTGLDGSFCTFNKTRRRKSTDGEKVLQLPISIASHVSEIKKTRISGDDFLLLPFFAAAVRGTIKCTYNAIWILLFFLWIISHSNKSTCNVQINLSSSVVVESRCCVAENMKIYSSLFFMWNRIFPIGITLKCDFSLFFLVTVGEVEKKLLLLLRWIEFLAELVQRTSTELEYTTNMQQRWSSEMSRWSSSKKIKIQWITSWVVVEQREVLFANWIHFLRCFLFAKVVATVNWWKNGDDSVCIYVWVANTNETERQSPWMNSK